MSAPSSNLGRVGVYRRWPSQKTQFKRYVEAARIHEARVLDAIVRYVESGERPVRAVSATDLPPWTSLQSELASRSTFLLGDAQIRSVRAGQLDQSVASAIAYAYAAMLIDLYVHESFPRRFPGRQLRMFSLNVANWIACGYAVGCKTVAERSAELLLAALRRGFVFDCEHYPIFYFILRVFADHRRIPLGRLAPAATREHILNALFENWRATDLAEISSLVLAACDHHTHRCRANDAKEFFEFNDGLFTHFPVEVLMLYRLREYEGLSNPDVDHPLMSTPLGKLSDPMRCEPDELLQRVLARAKSQGFDEEAIVRSVLAG